ncbi:MAG: RNA polymerase factor sigma-32 [Deltaproteobacteria bacterium]|nr:RNA polymerase factor sigma-32 [Deltaproteobacteria bacterium]
MAKPRKPTKSKTAMSKPKVVTPEVLERVSRTSRKPGGDDVDDDESDSDDAEYSEDTAQELTGENDRALAMGSGDSLPALLSTGSELEPTAIPQHKDLLKRYLEEVSRYELLTPQEEFELASRLKDTGDLEAARRMVRANLRLVVKIAMEYRSAYQNVLDLIQEGNIGLMKAVSKFDPAKGAKLSYYAGWWIRSYILKYILDNFRLVKVGTTQAQKKLFFQLMREKERLEAQGIHAGPKLLAANLDVRERDVVEMEQRLSSRGAEMSLNNPLESNGDGPSVTHLDMLADLGAGADSQLEQEELKDILKSRLEEFAKTLKEKELAVFRERLTSDQPKTLQEVADQFGLTRERARQIEAQVVDKLRDYYKKYIR